MGQKDLWNLPMMMLVLAKARRVHKEQGYGVWRFIKILL